MTSRPSSGSDGGRRVVQLDELVRGRCATGDDLADHEMVGRCQVDSRARSRGSPSVRGARRRSPARAGRAAPPNVDCAGRERGWRRSRHTSSDGGVRAATGCPTRGYRALTGRLPRADSTIGGRCPPNPTTAPPRAPKPAAARGWPPAASCPTPTSRRPRSAATEPRGSFLGRIFPPAPPLPNKPPPLAGFDESGPLRPIRVRAFLLRRNLAAWVVTGLVAAAGYYASVRLGPTDPLSLAGTFAMFGALIAAGWFGWQRPPLYGTAAAILSFVLVALAVVVTSAMLGITPDAFGPARPGREQPRPPGHLPGRARLPGRLVRRLPAATPDPAEQRSRADDPPPLTECWRRPPPSSGRQTSGTRLARVGGVRHRESTGRQRTPRRDPSPTEARA